MRQYAKKTRAPTSKGVEGEIQSAAREIRTDSYEMSFGELINLYRDNELLVEPDFQRLFRWSTLQKSQFVESLLLNFPIPPIFVFETKNGAWELVDGLQRVSTVLEFANELRYPGKNNKYPGSKLVGTRSVPSLEGMTWEKLPRPLQLVVKRARIGVQILRRGSDEKSKYDLFQRLNSGGSLATAQELRNCAIIMISPGFFAFLKGLAKNPNFIDVLHLTDKLRRQQGDLEYVVRFLVLAHTEYDGRMDVEEFLDGAILEICELVGVDWKRYESEFGFLDNDIVDRRNHIAHGKFLPISREGLRQDRDRMFKMMRNFKTDLENLALTVLS